MAEHTPPPITGQAQENPEPRGKQAEGYPFIFYLPDVGEGLRSGEIIEWMVTEGESVEQEQVIVVVETAKSTLEIPSPVAGEVVRLLEPVGEVVEVETPIIELRTAEPQVQAPITVQDAPAARAGTSPAGRMPAKPGADDTASAEENNSAGESKHLVGRGKMPVKPGGTGAKLPPKPGAKNRTAPKAAPAVRRLARALGVDLKTVTGTGASGAITADDVHAAAEHPTGGTTGGEA